MNELPLGTPVIALTYLQREEVDADMWSPDALLTVRVKDQDLTADQLESLGRSCLKVAAAIRTDEKETP